MLEEYNELKNARDEDLIAVAATLGPLNIGWELFDVVTDELDRRGIDW